MHRFAILFCPMLLLTGCGSDSRLMPLAVGKKWTYRFRWGVRQEVGALEVAREVAVNGTTGYELSSPMGVSRLGYDGPKLVASQLANAFFKPALPIGLPSETHTKWHGQMQNSGGMVPASAVIESTPANVRVDGAKRSLILTHVKLTVGNRKIDLLTWFAPGEGIIQQEQRTNSRLDVSLERIATL